jgi:hypothetical protein
MALAREYFPSDTIKIINQSESLMVRNGRRMTNMVTEGNVAHSIGRHLLRGAPGSRGLGIGEKDFADRFLNSPENLSSAWMGKGEMAILLCELLNSEIGQLALRRLDTGVPRVVVHYLNQSKLAALLHGAQFKESRVIVTPASEKIVLEKLFNSKTGAPIMVNGVQKETQRKIPIPRTASSEVKAKQIIAVNAVLDRFNSPSSGLHLQTLYPSSEATESYAEWRVGGVSMTAGFSKGQVVERMMPRDFGTA